MNDNGTNTGAIADDSFPDRAKAEAIAANVERFVRDVVIPCEYDSRRDHHDCPTDELTRELRQKARNAGVLTPHIFPDGGHLSQRGTALVLIKSGLSPLGPLACNTAAPDEGNMYLLGKMGRHDVLSCPSSTIVGYRWGWVNNP